MLRRKYYITFTVPIEQKLTSIDKNGEEIAKIYLPYYNLLIAQDLWQAQYQILSIVFLKEFIKLKVNLNVMMKSAKTCRIKCEHCDCFLDNTSFKDDLIKYKCLCCNKNYQHKFDEKLKEHIFNTYKLSNHDNNKVILLL